jgi:hypothetical protein
VSVLLGCFSHYPQAPRTIQEFSRIHHVSDLDNEQRIHPMHHRFRKLVGFLASDLLPQQRISDHDLRDHAPYLRN